MHRAEPARSQLLGHIRETLAMQALRARTSLHPEPVGRIAAEGVLVADVPDQVVERGVPALTGDQIQWDVEISCRADEASPQATPSPSPLESGNCGRALDNPAEQLQA